MFTPLYLDPSQPLQVRLQDLIARMTLDEKISQMVHKAPAVPRLGIPAYNYWSEALHGVARNGNATVFPQAIGLAATWNPALIEQIGSATGDEGRAKYHDALRRFGGTQQYQGLTFWSPNVNIFRDPRWGRGQETWGEDPYLTGQMGAAYVRGLQGNHPRYLKAAACAKHYAVHSGPEADRHHFDAIASKREMVDTYLPAFKELVTRARVESVMSAYNRTNGEACSASPTLLRQILREEWGFEGHVVSDCGAVGDIYLHHHTAADAAEAAAVALKAGCDLECGHVYAELKTALERGLLSEADIDRSLARSLATRFKLGMFDPAAMVPYAATPMSVVGCARHRKLARQAARESVVLLKNKNNLLPIKQDVKHIFLTGPTAADINVLLGNYNGLNANLVTLLEGVLGRLPEHMQLVYRTGSMLALPPKGAWDESACTPPGVIHWEAIASDLVIACLGTSPAMEGEEGESFYSDNGGDRKSISLPAPQVELLKVLAKTGMPLILVLTGGSPIALNGLEEVADAILFTWYPGQEGGAALAEVLFGDAAPSGKLPITFPRSLDQLPPFEDYRMAQRTYRYSSAEPLFPFGFGLSYTTFEYSQLKLAKKRLTPGQPLSLSVTVVNTGSAAAEEVVQVYLSDLAASVPVPQHKLAAFRRVALKPGQSKRVRFSLPAEAMELIDEAGCSRLEAGEFRVTVGGCSPGARGLALGAPQPQEVVFSVGG